jgi:hypothetical protein
MRHACLAFMLAGDDGQGSHRARTHRQRTTDGFFIDYQFMGFPAVRPSPIARSSSPSVQHPLPTMSRLSTHASQPLPHSSPGQDWLI